MPDEQQPQTAPQDEDSRPFFRPTNNWRLIGLASIVLSHFVHTPELETSWFKISSLAGVGILTVLWPHVQEVLNVWKNKK